MNTGTLGRMQMDKDVGNVGNSQGYQKLLISASVVARRWSVALMFMLSSALAAADPLLEHPLTSKPKVNLPLHPPLHPIGCVLVHVVYNQH